MGSVLSARVLWNTLTRARTHPTLPLAGDDDDDDGSGSGSATVSESRWSATPARPRDAAETGRTRRCAYTSSDGRAVRHQLQLLSVKGPMVGPVAPTIR